MKNYNIEEFDNIIQYKFQNFESLPPSDMFVKIKKTIFLKKVIQYFTVFSVVIFLSTFIVFKIGNRNIYVEPLKIYNNISSFEGKFLNNITNSTKDNNIQILRINIKERDDINSKECGKKEEKNYINEIGDIINKNEDQGNIYNYKIKLKPSICGNKNGAIYIDCNNCDDIEFIFNNEILKGKIENIASGFYKIYVRKGTRIIDTLSVFIKDSLKIKPDFNIFELPANNSITLYFENISTIDHNPWTTYDNCSFLWYINNQKISAENNVVYQFTNNGNFNIKLICNYNNVCIDSIFKNYIINIPTNIEGIQNIFTPNSDGINDYFEPQLIGYKIEECSIFDRNGVLVYSVKNGEIQWDGKILNSNNSAPEGVYYYIIKAVNKDNKNIDIKGMLYLKR